MVVQAVLSLHRALILVVLTVALTATGFAHRMPTAQDQAIAFAVANGAEASDFCGGVPGKDGLAGVHCPACQITASADLPSLEGNLIDLARDFQTRIVAPREQLAVRTIRDPAHPPQGPPIA